MKPSFVPAAPCATHRQHDPHTTTDGRCDGQPTHRLESVVSSALTEGDVVWTHGMRVLIGEPRQSPHGSGGQPVTWAPGTILNADDLDAWLASYVRSVNAPDRDPNHWTIQGNDLARWAVERPVEALTTV